MSFFFFSGSSPAESAVVIWSRTDASVSAWVMFHRCLVFGSSAQALYHSAHSRHTSAAFAWWRASFGTLPQRFHVGIHHGPRTMSNTYSTQTHQCASCASRQRPTWPATCASINVFAAVEATKDPRIVMHLPVQSDGAVDISSVPLRPPSIPGASTRVTCGSKFGQKIKRQLSLAEICPAVTQ